MVGGRYTLKKFSVCCVVYKCNKQWDISEINRPCTMTINNNSNNNSYNSQEREKRIFS